MPNFVLGMNAKIYEGTDGAALGALTEMDNVKDVTLSMEADEADVTTRANAGWRGIAPSLRSAEVTFEMIWKAADAGFTAIKDAYLISGGIELAVFDGDKGVSGNQGLKGTFGITGFTRNEPLEGPITVSVTAKLSTFDSWVII